jgi:hypothetical protein
MATSYATIGQPVGRAEGPEKVTGTAVYPADINLPGTLVGKIGEFGQPLIRKKTETMLEDISTEVSQRLQ